MTLTEVLTQLKIWGNESTKRVYKNHGAKEPLFGVKITALKLLVKKIKKDHELALSLYKTGNSDAMYLAGLIADEDKITKEQLNDWVKKANWYMLSEVAVASLAAESPYGKELAGDWIDSNQELIASAGWSTYSNLISIRDNTEIDLEEVRALLKRVAETIHDEKNRVRYAMNGFVIAVATYMPELKDEALAIAESNGKVEVSMGNTSCKVPYAPEYIKKVYKKGIGGKKRKSARS